MAKVENYTTAICPYCLAAKRLLGKKGVSYTEIDVMMKPGMRDKMIERANGRHTVPQIFINDQHVGGYDDLAELDADGELDPMLAG